MKSKPKLQELTLRSITLTAEQAKAFPKLQSLKKFRMSPCEDVDFSFLSKLSACTELNLEYIPSTAELSPVGSMKALNDVILFFNSDCEQDLSWMSKAKWRSRAQSLRLLNFDLNDLSFLKGFTALKTLFASGPFSDVSVLGKLKNLETLSLQDSKIEDITALGKLTKLRSLHLSGSLVSDVTPLAKCKKLTHLSVDGTCVTDLSPLAKLSSLKYATVSTYCENIPEHVDVTVNEWADWPLGDTGAPVHSLAEELFAFTTTTDARQNRTFSPFMGVQLKLENGMYTLYDAQSGSVIIPPKPAQYVTFDALENGETVLTYYFPEGVGDGFDLYSYHYRLDGTPVSLDHSANLPIRWNRDTHRNELLNAQNECVATAEFIDYMGHGLYALHNPQEEISYGIVDAEGQIILPQSGGCYAEMCEIDDGWILLVTYMEPYGFNYLKMDGTWMFDQPVEEAGVFSEGLAPVKLPGHSLMSYIDPEGNEIIPAQFTGAKPFSEGRALVVNEDWSRSYIDHNGNRLYNLDLSTSSSFRSAHAIITTGNNSLYGVMNMEGEITMQPQWPELDIHRFEHMADITPCVLVYDHNEETGLTHEWNLDFTGNLIAGGLRAPAGWDGLTNEMAQQHLDEQNDSFYTGDFVSVPLWVE